MIRKLSALLILLLTGCVGIPDRVKPVDNFKIEQYLGRWYEIARLDHSFEHGLTQVTADYSVRDDGGLRVLNRGYSEKNKRWKEVEGKAYFVDKPDQGYLKVSFWGPFYSSYVIFALDHDKYQYALVCGPDKSYFWILARTSKITDEVRNTLVAKAKDLGFDTGNLIYVSHE